MNSRQLFFRGVGCAALVLGSLAVPASARAAELSASAPQQGNATPATPSPATPSPATPSPATPSPATPSPVATGAGLAVVAMDGAADVAWTLAQGIYGSTRLRPARLTESQARALMGDAAPDASADARELAEMRGGVRGEDASSRAVLAELARRLGVRALVVVRTTPESRPEARLFLTDGGTFDAARYAPDDGPPPPTWAGTVRSLEASFGPSPEDERKAQAAAEMKAKNDRLNQLRAQTKEGSGSRPFYTSPWFWGAIGAAALGTTAAVFALRDTGSDTIHLQMTVPP